MFGCLALRYALCLVVVVHTDHPEGKPGALNEGLVPEHPPGVRQPGLAEAPDLVEVLPNACRHAPVPAVQGALHPGGHTVHELLGLLELRARELPV